MTNNEAVGCPEFRELSRRRFMAGVGVAAAAAATAPAWLPRVTLAKSYRTGPRDVLVVVFMRGAADGLSLVVPFSEAGYYAARPVLAVPRPDSTSSLRAIDLQVTVNGPNGAVGFGLSPALAPLLTAFQAGHLLIVHAAGSTDPTRSHFDAQRFMEIGKPNDVLLSTGWMARHLIDTPPLVAGSRIRGVGLSTSLPMSFQGAPDTRPVSDLGNASVLGRPETASRRVSTMTSMYNAASEPSRSVGLETFDTINLLNNIHFATYAPSGGAAYGTDTFGQAMKSAAALIKAQVGVEVIAIDCGNWDTHSNQGVTAGTMANLMSSLASGLAAFHTDMFSAAAPSFSLVCMSEFGRRLAENASFGTDHGHAGAMFLMGNAIHGGRVLTQWPGLGAGQLFEGIDLQVTTDYRDILAEIAANRLGNTNLPDLFPAYTPTFRGVLL